MKTFILVLSSIYVNFCFPQKSIPRVIEGDLCFKQIIIGSSSEMMDSIEMNWENMDEFVREYFHLIKNNGLTDSYPIQILLSGDELFKTVYLPKVEYYKIQSYNGYDLQNQNQKIKLKIIAEKIDANRYKGEEIIYFEKTSGTTIVIK